MLYNPAARRSALPSYDWAMLWVAVALLGAGLVMVYSASIAVADAKSANHSPTFYLTRHAMYLILGVGAAYGLLQVPSNLWQKSAPILFILGAVLLMLVLVPFVGKEVNGSRRWISLGPLGNMQPSELMKWITVIYAADYTARKAALMGDVRKGFLPMFLVMLGIGGLLLMEPDFGAFVVIIAIALGILFLGGLNGRLLAGLIALLSLGFVLLIWLSPYRLQRVIGFLDPWADPYGKGYQLSHSLMAFGRGEWFGVGLGDSVEKLFYLPEAYTDFLLAVIGEELGFFGVAAIVALFAWLSWRALTIGWQAAQMGRNFQALVAQGIGIWIGVQSFINMGVNLGLMPTKGLTLPFMSYGGSGIVANCLALGILFRIDYENRCLMRGKRQ